MAGRMMCLTPPYPEVGSHPSFTPNNSMSSMANQKSGMDCPPKTYNLVWKVLKWAYT